MKKRANAWIILIISVLIPIVLIILGNNADSIVVKTAMTALGVSVLLAEAAALVLGGVIADRILYQNRGKDTRKNSLEQLKSWGFDHERFVSEYKGKEICLKAEDGNTVPGSYFENGSTKCAVLVHGAGGDRICIEPLACEYLKRGYDVFAIDQRGCGANEDKRVTFGINERLDVKAAVKYARTLPGISVVIVHGQSMGAQTAALYASKERRGRDGAADAVICDSPVPGMESTLKTILGNGDPDSIRARAMTAAGKLFMLLFYGIDFDDGDTVKAVGSVDIPTMIILSERDAVCIPEDVEKVFDSVSCGNKALIRVNSDHIGGVIDDPDGYMEAVIRFIGSAGV